VTVLRLGTRGSSLARVQADAVRDRLLGAHPSLEIETVEIATQGDVDQQSALSSGSSVGWFTSAIQRALLDGLVDFAVHSYKDLPTARPEGLVIAAVPSREDPRDALVTRSGKPLQALLPGAVIGTSSPRREAQVREMRPDVEVRPIRGNVETRIRKVDDGEYDGAVLALAGLRRLGLEPRAAEVFGVYDMVPAPAQGALAVECRSADEATRRLLAAIHDVKVGQAVSAERAFLAALEAGCSFPAAAYAEQFGSTIKVHGVVASGGHVSRAKITGPVEAAAGLGRELAAELLAAMAESAT
jgi:hydroxymethylbilane synthase